MKQADERHGARSERFRANKIMIVFTDGWNNKGPDPEKMSKEAQKLGFEVFSVGIIVSLIRECGALRKVFEFTTWEGNS